MPMVSGPFRRVVHGGRRVAHERTARRRALGRARRRTPQILFIVTYGRSGSTLLQGILNAIPGYLIRGENRWALYDLYRFHDKSVRARNAQFSAGRRLGPEHPWFGADDFPVDASLIHLRRLVTETILRPGRRTRVCGFKEIMWASGDYAEFVDPGYIDFLLALFPDARFLINTRDLAATARSGWWPRRENAAETLRMADAQVRDLAARLGERAFHVHYDDYVRDIETLRPLFAWLGEPFDAESLRAVLDVQHSS